MTKIIGRMRKLGIAREIPVSFSSNVPWFDWESIVSKTAREVAEKIAQKDDGKIHSVLNRMGYVMMRKTKMDRYKARIAHKQVVIEKLRKANGDLAAASIKKSETGKCAFCNNPIRNMSHEDSDNQKTYCSIECYEKQCRKMTQEKSCDIYRTKKRFSDRVRKELAESGVTEYQMYLNEKFQELQLPDLELLDAIVQFESMNSTIKALNVFLKFLEKSKELYVFRSYKDIAKLNELIISIRKQIKGLEDDKNNLKNFLDGKEE